LWRYWTLTKLFQAATLDRMLRICLSLTLSLVMIGCGSGSDPSAVNVAIIGSEASLSEQGVRLSPAAQHLRGATSEGLVALDPAGQIVPAIAERWIVTDDGSSYIFRLRDAAWSDGEAVTAADVRILLQDKLRRLEGTSLGLDLAKVTDIRAMTGRVVELRLSGPMPDFLRLLAQPELGFVRNGIGTGPMVVSDQDNPDIALLSALPPQVRGLPERQDWEQMSRNLTVRALPARAAVDAFSNGDVDLLLNGTMASFPMAQLGPLSRGTVQVDPARGLFGLAFKSEEGLLADPARREALSMALDRNDLIEPFGLGGWQPATQIVPDDLFSQSQALGSRWENLSIEERRAIARQRIAAWESGNNQEAVLRIGMPEGPGSELLFQQIAAAWQQIGVTSVRVGMGEGAELELYDRLARYSSPRWFLNQFHCSLKVGICSPEADALVLESLALKDVAAKQSLLANAHGELIAAEAFIPLGIPVRWSLVRGAVDGYQANQWGLHPLFPLSEPTT